MDRAKATFGEATANDMPAIARVRAGPLRRCSAKRRNRSLICIKA
jgi:hypothetical protein